MQHNQMGDPTSLIASAPDSRREVSALASAPLQMAAAAMLALLGACGGGGSKLALEDQLPSQIGAPNPKPGSTGLFNGALYLVDPHKGGAAGEVRLLGVAWGRLADVYDTQQGTGAHRLVYPDLVIAETVVSESGTWTLDANSVTGRFALTIDRENTAAVDDPFDFLVQAAQENLGPILPKGVSLAEAPPFSFVARNSVMVVTFDDLIDESTLALNDSVKVGVGNPPVTPFDARLFLDKNHGGISPLDGQFHSTRLIVDTTLSESEQFTLSEPLALNGAGLPASSGNLQANVALRFPTKVNASVGQFEILRNLSGRALGFNNNGPIDLGTSTIDVVRAMRSGNSNDQNNGFLEDNVPPRLLGIQPLQVTSAVLDPNFEPAGYSFILGVTFSNIPCALDPVIGDVVQIGTQLQLTVTQPGAVSQGNVAGLRVQLPFEALPQNPSNLIGPGLITTPFRSGLSPTIAPCFVRFSPNSPLPPNLGIAPQSQVVLRFSEPIDPQSLKPFDSLFVLNKPTKTSFRDYVVGDVFSSSDLVEARFIPLLPFSHVQGGTPESYFLNMVSTEVLGVTQGITDLSGNRLADVLPQIPFSLDQNAATSRNAGFTLRFDAVSEDSVAGDDLRGQFVYDLTAGTILPRPFSRTFLVCDRTVPIVGQMAPSLTGLQEPLSNLGSKLHAMWRYCDVGLPQFMLQEDSFPNLDVEGISLSPIGGQVTSTFYPQFEMRLGHSDRIPDELFDPMTGAPIFPNSGFFDSATYSENYLDDPKSGPFIVHPRQLGFLVSSAEVFITPTNTPMVHFPLNRNLAPEDKVYTTWRDTSIQTWGGRNLAGDGLESAGVPVTFDVAISGEGVPGDQYGVLIPMFNEPGPPGMVTPPGVPTVGLPLLMEFRCYPGESLSVNTFDVSQAPQNPGRPFYRAFSAGGFNQQGQPVLKDPDSQTSPTGGFNANPAVGAIGQATNARDKLVYIGQMDLVTRISRVHTVLFNSNQANPDWAGVVQEPRASLQPNGTQIVLAYRGDDSTNLPPTSPFFNTALLDVYGEPVAATNALILDNPTWSENISASDNQRYIQLRITFVSNPVTELSPTLSGLGVAYRF